MPLRPKKLMIPDRMELIKKAFFFLLFLLCGSLIFSQSKPALLSAEISSIEKKLSDTKLSAVERKSALETMARLFELSGNIEAAAGTWEKAAKTVSGNAGHADLLQSARCFAAIGEFEKADAVLKPVLSASGNKVLQNKARILSAQIEALKTGNTAILSDLLSNPDFAGEKPVLYYSLWRISADPAFRSAIASRLLSELPQSPEARIIRDDNAVSAVPAALWLLTGIEQSPVTVTVTPAAGNTTGSSSGGPALLQTGLFTVEQNAGNMANKLRNAGFTPVIEKKTVNGKEHWIVGVLPGPDLTVTMKQLKDKGFESFPVNL